MIRIAVVIAVFLLSCAAAFGGNAVSSASANPQVPHESPCAADARRFCNDVPYGGGRRLACLAHHEAQLSAACRPRLKILQAMFAYGQEQHRRTEARLAKQAEAAKQNAASAQKTAAPPHPQ